MTLTFIGSQLYDELTKFTNEKKPELLANIKDQVFLYPDWLGSGYKNGIELHNGIYLTIHNYQLKRDLIKDCREENEECLEFVFNLSSVGKLSDRSRITTPHHYLSGIHQTGNIWYESAHHKALAVDIHLSPSTLTTLFDEYGIAIPEKINSFCHGDNQEQFSQLLKISPNMTTVLKQMINCPYQGITKYVYLEAKSLELIALHLQMTTELPSSGNVKSFKSRDKEAIYYAREILRTNYDNPPDLTTLARQVGLNTKKLKEGFRYLFNNTVFGDLREYRLEMAKKLLKEERAITVVASMVGYASPSAFTIAFHRQFGINPKTYQMKSLSSMI